MKTLSAEASRKKLGEHIRKLREEQGLSQDQLSFESGVSRELISRIESGQRNFSHDTIHAIAAALNVTLSELYDFG